MGTRPCSSWSTYSAPEALEPASGPSLRFLKASCSAEPKVMFRDMTARKDSGPCFWTNFHQESEEIGHGAVRKANKAAAKKAVPHKRKARRTGRAYPRAQVQRVKLYQAGTVCKDISRQNVNRKAIQRICKRKSGASTKTLHSSLSSSRVNRPALILLENTLDQPALQLTCELLEEDDYSVWPLVNNAEYFGSGTSRTRFYVLGMYVEQMEVEGDLADWNVQVDRICQNIPRLQCQAYCFQMITKQSG